MSRSTTLTASVRIEEGAHAPHDGVEQLVAALASSYAAELAAAAERLAVPVDAIEVDAAAHLTERTDGRHDFVALELAAVVDAPSQHTERLQLAAELALDRCPVVAALDVPLSHAVRIQEVARR